MRKQEVELLSFTQRLDYCNTRHFGGDEDEEAAEAAERAALLRRLRENRKPLPSLDIDEIMRTLPKRRYTRRAKPTETTIPKPKETNDDNHNV